MGVLDKFRKPSPQNNTQSTSVLDKFRTAVPTEETTKLVPAGRDKDGIPIVTEESINQRPEIVLTQNKEKSNTIPFYGFDLILPKTVSKETEEEDSTPYKGLLAFNTKKALTSFSAPLPLEQTRNEIEILKNANPDQISEFTKIKKQEVNDFYNQQKAKLVTLDTPDQATDYGKLEEEQRQAEIEIDNTAIQKSFTNAPFMYNNINDYLNAPDDIILKNAELVGNDIQNITDDKKRTYVKTTSGVNVPGVGVDKIVKENLAYLGLQAEAASTTASINDDTKTLETSINKINELIAQLNENPNQPDLVKQVQDINQNEILPLQQVIRSKETFLAKLQNVGKTLPEIDKQIKRQKEVDENFLKYSVDINKAPLEGLTPYTLLPAIGYSAKGLSNRLLSSLQGAAIIANDLAERLGTKSTNETTRNSINLLSDESLQFTLPKKIKEGDILEKDKEGNITGVNVNVALPMTLQTTAEMLTMGGFAAPLAKYGTLGKFAGLYVGSTVVFGGDLLKGELEKGLTMTEAVAVTGLRLGIEAGTEMINPSGLIPFNGVIKKGILGKAISKSAYMDFVIQNAPTLIPKWKKLGLDVSRVIYLGAKGTISEVGEEVGADFGNMVLDKIVALGIKPDYRQDNEFTVENEINTALTTALTMLPMGAYQGVMERQAEKQAPIIRWSASQTPKIFLQNLESNLKKGLITKDFYETGKKEVETINNIYEANKVKINNVEEEERPTYLNLLYEQEKISNKILNTFDEKESEKLGKELEDIFKKIQYFDSEAVNNINATPIQKNKKIENRHLENLKTFASEEEINSASIEDLNVAKTVLQEVVNNPFSENVGEEAKKQIEKILVQEGILKNSIKEAEEIKEQKIELTPIQEFENRISTASQEDLEKLRVEIQDNSEFSKEGRQLRKKILERENDLLEEEKNITFKDGKNSVTFKEGTYVTYEGNTYKVQKDKDGKPLLLNDKTDVTVRPSDVLGIEIKKQTFTPVEKQEPQDKIIDGNLDSKDFVSQEGLFEVFGEPTQKENSQDIEAKKADIERRRQEELNNHKNNLYDDRNIKYAHRQIVKDLEAAEFKLNSQKGYLNLADNSPKEIIRFNKDIEETKKEIEKYQNQLDNFIKDVSKEINAKYDAELADLERTTTQESNTEAKKAGIEGRSGLNGVEEIIFSNPNFRLEGFEIDGNYWNVVTSTDRAKVLVNINGVIVPFYLTTGQAGKGLVPGWYPFFGIGKDGWLNKTDKSDMETYYERYWGKETADIVKSISEELNSFYGTNPSTFKNDGDPNATSRPLTTLADKVEDYINSKLNYTPAINDADARKTLRSNVEQLGREINAKYNAELKDLENVETEEHSKQEVSEEKPTTTEPVISEESKEFKKEVEKTIEKYEESTNQFKSGNNKSSNWLAVVSKLYNQFKKEGLNDYRISVVNANTIDFEDLSENTQEYWRKQAIDKKIPINELIAKDKGKYLVLSDKEGNTLYFNKAGEITTEETGKPVISNFSDGALISDKETYNKITEARKNNSTHLIDRIVYTPSKLTKKVLTLAKDVLGENPLKIIRHSDNRAYIKIGDELQPATTRPLTSNEIETIIAISKNLGGSGLVKDTQPLEEKNNSERYQKSQYLTNLIFSGTGKGKINFELKFGKGENNAVVTIKQTDGAWKIPTESELKDFLSKQWININYSLLESPTSFTTYRVEGTRLIEDTVYKNYTDFLKEIVKVPSTEIGDTNEHYTIEVGAVDDSIKAKLIEAETVQPKIEVTEQPKEEKTTPLDNTPIRETPTKKIVKKEFKKKSDTKDNPLSGNLFRNRRLNNKVTEKQNNEAISWFKSHPISGFIKLNHFQNIINSDAFASWNKSGITLWNESNFTDLYHEAWHEFSQLYLTKAQKQALYNEVRNKLSNKKLSDFEVEEHVAEDFYKYVLSFKEGKPLILNNQPKRNSIFRRVYNFLKEFITGNTDIQTYYERLYTGNINNYKRDLNNAFFGSLNVGLKINVDGETKTLTNEETKQLYRGLDSLISNLFEEISQPIATLFAKNNVLSVVYDKVFDKFNEEYENYVDKYNNTTDELEQENLQQIITNLEYTLSNWNNVLAHHKRFSPYFNLSKDVVQFDDENNLIDNEVDEDELTRSSEIEKNNNVSSKEVASNETIYLVATLPRYENGRLAVNPFFPFINDIVDFNSTWNQLTNVTNNTLDYGQIIDKIDNLGNKNHSFKNLLDRIPKKEDILTDAQSRLKSAFINDISKPRIEEQELVLSLDEKGNLNGFYKAAAATDVDVIKKNWLENFNKIEGGYKTENKESGVISLDTQKLLDDFKSSVMITKSDLQKADKNEIYAKRVEFLNNLGITFSDETILDPDFKEVILSENNPVTGIYLQLKKRLNANEIIINPFKDVAKYQRLLSEQELKHSETLSTQSVKNPEGNNVWLIRQWNYTSKIYNALNNVEKYPTYQDFQNTPWLKSLDENSNPYVKGAFLNSIFDLTPNSPTYGKRRTKNGVYVKLTLESYAGIKLQGEKGVKNQGTNTTSLTAFEKLVQNINTLLLEGAQEHLRYGDKSSSFATRISHIYDPVSKQLEERKILVPREEFYDYQNKNSVALPLTAFQFLLGDLKAEIVPMKRNFKTGLGNNIKNYSKNIKELGVFEGILSKETFEKLKTQIIENNDVVETKTFGDTETKDISDVLKSLSKEIRIDIENYIEEKAKDLQKELGIKSLKSKELNNILIDRMFYVHSNKTIKNVIPSQIMYAYVVNSLLYNIEHTKIVTQDPRFYSAKGDKKNPFKRFSAWSATGNLFIVDDQTNEYIASKTDAIKEAVAKKLNITITPSSSNGDINSVIFKDVIRDTKYFKLYTDLLAKTGQFSEEVLKSWYKAYNGITESDGQGYVTLDELRKSKLRAGSSHWTKAHEDAYQVESAFISGKSSTGMTLEQVALFPPQKWQYAGSTAYFDTKTNQEITIPVFYKFSVAPLIPSAIKGTSFESIHDNLIKQNVGLALFESGSKMSAITDSEGNFNSFYENQQERTPYTGEYIINTINYEHLKEQVNIDPEIKEKVTFSTQMRKLLFLNTFSNGVPIDAPKGMTLEQWDALSDADKKKNSSFYKLEQKFNKVIDNLVNLERNKVLEQLGATKKLTGGYKLDNAKVARFLQEEFEKRGLPDEIIDYFQVDQNGNFTYPLDASKSRDKIEQIVYSIANRRLVQQKINGDALIQVAATGFEMMKGFESYQEDADLPFYEPGEDGITKAQKVKIAFSSKWKPLLNLNYKGEKIETLDRLNQAIKDENWMKIHKEFVTLTAVRIPVQGLNSMEFMEVFHFLPESSANVIIVSPSLVAKSGGDFDIDKLTTFFPNIFNNKYTGKVKLYNSKDLKIKDSNLSKQIKDIVKPSKEKLKALTKIRQELSSEMSVYKSQKEGIKATKDEIKLSLRKLDVEIAVYNEQLDLLEEVEFALTNPDDITAISNLVAETLGENALVEATQSAIEQTKNTIKTKINEGITNQQFLLKAINTSLKELNEDLNYTRLEINNINKAINPVKEFLGKMQELVYESSAKKAYENEVISIIKEVLSHPDNFAQLVRPNDTDFLNNEDYGAGWFKKNSTEKKDKTWTGVVDFSEIKKQFLSNLVGKASLGIAAVNNTFFALSQRAGLYLNDGYTTFQGKKQKPILNKTRINLSHNTVNIGGKELPSLSSKLSKNGNYQISDIISQFINGFVDVANDDWVFFINAVKEYTPTMLFLNQLGVDVKTNIAFFNQPILKEYLASVQKKKNLFNRLRNPELYTFATNRSVEEIFINASNVQDEKLQHLIFELIIKQNDPKGITFFEYKAVLDYLQEKAEQNKETFSIENLSKSVYNNTLLTTDENLMILAHYLELKKMGDTVTTLQRGLNADTKKVGSSYAVEERQALIEQAKKSKLFPEDIVSKMRNSSAISAFTNEKTGFDKFSKDLFEDLFELTGNDIINSTLKELTSRDTDLKSEYRFSDSSKLISTFKNDFISYIYQKNVYDGNTLIFKLIEPLFNPKSSLAKELQVLKSKYPELSKEFPILDILTPDILRIGGKEIKSNLKFKYNLNNRDEINNSVQNIRQLLNFNNSNYTKENQLEIQDFTKKLVKFAIVQSGLNNSVFNIMDMIPNEEYTKDLTKAVKESIEIFKNRPSDAKKAIEKFYNQSFKDQNPSFFNKLTDEEGYVKGNKNPERGKTFFGKGMETETTELVKQNKKQEFINSIPSLTRTYDTNVASALKENKDTLLIIEDNTLKSKTSPLEKDKAFIGTIFTKNDSKQPLSDEDFIKNQELIDRAIELIIDKAYDKSNLKGIKFPEQGVGQDLLTSSPETFNYLSQRLKDSFDYDNPNFIEKDFYNEPDYIKQASDKIMDQIKLTPRDLEIGQEFIDYFKEQELEQPINKEIKPNEVNLNPTNISEENREEYKNYVLDKIGKISKVIKIENGYEVIFENAEKTKIFPKQGQFSGLSKYTKESGADIKIFAGINKLIENQSIEIKPKIDSSKKINIYAGTNENTELSNLANRPFTLQGVEYDNVEQYFQLQKFQTAGILGFDYDSKNAQQISDKINEIADKIANTKSGFEAKKLGGTRITGITLNEEFWNKINSSEMKKAIKASFEQNPKALQQLLATGNAELTHTQESVKSKWRTEFPKLLMEVRQELTQEQPIVEETKEELPGLDNLPDPQCK